jgi:hypothetical protein
MTNLLTKQTAKLSKTQTDNTQSVIMYLDPTYNNQVCKAKTKGCSKGCLINSGRMIMKSAVQARYNRTELYFNNKEVFNAVLVGELYSELYKANKNNKKLAVRLNGTSDLDFTHIYKQFPTIQFYEYTKRPDLARNLSLLDNVHITFSRSEVTKDTTINKLINKGINIAVVFTKEVPKTYKGLTVIDGDKHDRRFEDKQGQIIGLKLKGTKEAKNHAITTGFSVSL